MTVYSIHIFNSKGTCLYEKEWKRSKQSSLPKEQELKLTFGMIHSINSFVARMSPTDFKDGFLSYTTSAYKLHFFETSTGLKFVLLTDVNIGNMRELLRKLYCKVYVEYVVRNPLIDLHLPITSSLFDCKLEEYLTEYGFFTQQKLNVWDLFFNGPVYDDPATLRLSIFHVWYHIFWSKFPVFLSKLINGVVNNGLIANVSLHDQTIHWTGYSIILDTWLNSRGLLPKIFAYAK